MTTQELIAKYNPANARNLTKEDLDAMRHLTNDQLKVLADAFPNGPRNRAYLVLYDNNLDEARQINTLSTWQNLYNVRKFSNMKNLVAQNFRETFQRPGPARRVTANVSSGNAALKGMSARKVIDLSAQDAANELRANAGASRAVTAGKVAAETQQAEAQTTGTVVPMAQDMNNVKAPSKVTQRSKPAAKTTPAPAPAAEEKAHVPADQEFGDPSETDVTDTNVGDPGGEGQEGGGQ